MVKSAEMDDLEQWEPDQEFGHAIETRSVRLLTVTSSARCALMLMWDSGASSSSAGLASYPLATCLLLPIPHVAKI